MTVVGGQAGVLQGERRWFPLAILYLPHGHRPPARRHRMLLFWQPDEVVAALGLAIGFAAPAVVGWLALRQSAAYRSATDSGSTTATAPSCARSRPTRNALLAFFALSNADGSSAGIVLDEPHAGLYAGGLILVKSLLFLPQFVVVLAFPSMSDAAARRATLIKSLALVVAARRGDLRRRVWALSGLALVFVGGDAVRRDPGPAVDLRRCSAPCSRCSSCSSTAWSPASRAGPSTWSGRHSSRWSSVGQLVDTVDQLLVTVVLAIDVVLLVALLAVSLVARPRRPRPSAGRTPEPRHRRR